MGKLTIVPTPIGNMEDMTFRAIRILKEVDVVLAEDTRTTSKLFQRYEISNKLVPYHLNNEHKIVERIAADIASGMHYALVSDAGTPAISDPGFLLIRACIALDVEIECLPGPTAFVPALVNSGFPSEKFIYEGFLPLKKGKQTRLQYIADQERTVVLYESPHRLLKTLKQFGEILEPNRQLSISREISKKFEETVRGNCEELIEHYTHNPIKGEFVMVIAGKENRKNKHGAN
ncbi:16S rRNA (cytidine(1402)-2'-O)-methyltransferase [Crocinitomicaceae bacterium]|nr:16S rRNA (cytidine(1402)-2'-O)-methyltransferase [Crocinitomicaceae bacterium]